MANARIRHILMAEIGDAVASQCYIPSSFYDYAARYWVCHTKHVGEVTSDFYGIYLMEHPWKAFYGPVDSYL